MNPVLIVLLWLLSFVTTTTSFARARSSLLMLLALDYLQNLFNYRGGSTFWIYLCEQSFDPIQFLIHKQLLRLHLVLQLLNLQLALSLLIWEQWLVHQLDVRLFLLCDEGPVQLSRLLQFSAQGFQSELVVEFFRLHLQQLLLKSSHLLLRLHSKPLLLFSLGFWSGIGAWPGPRLWFVWLLAGFCLRCHITFWA